MAKMDLPDIIAHCFRKPAQNEATIPLSSDKILEIISTDFPNIKYDRSTRVILGNTLKNLGYERREGHNGMLYYIVPKKAA